MYKKEFFKDARKNWVVLIKVHIIFLAALFFFYIQSHQLNEQILEVVIMSLITSLFIQLVLFRVKPEWFKDKKR